MLPSSRSPAQLMLASVMALALWGCAGGTPDMSEVASFIAADGPTTIGKPVDVYTRVALEAKECWFGASGPLRTTHIWTADVKPQSKGGDATVVVFERTPENERGLRAFEIVMKPDGDRTKLGIHNARFPDDIGRTLTMDIERWAAGELGCTSQATAWQPGVTPQVPN